MKNKCPYCQNKVILLRDKYICENCGASALAKSEPPHHPIGVLADEELRGLHYQLKGLVLKLWKESINDVCGFVVSYRKKKELRYGTLLSKGKPVQIKDLFTDDVVEADKYSTVTSLTKTLAWVSAGVGAKEPVKDYKFFNKQQSQEAIALIKDSLFNI